MGSWRATETTDGDREDWTRLSLAPLVRPECRIDRERSTGLSLCLQSACQIDDLQESCWIVANLLERVLIWIDSKLGACFLEDVAEMFRRRAFDGVSSGGAIDDYDMRCHDLKVLCLEGVV